VATDADLPANTLTYGNFFLWPPGLVVDPATGLLTWDVPSSWGGSNIVLVVTVSDNGEPPLDDMVVVFADVYPSNQVFEATAMPEPTGTGIVVRWSAETGETYRLYYADELFAPLWTALAGDVTATDVVAEKIDGTTNAIGQRFYRVIRLLP
jgi:hypothetical protein